VSIILIMKLRDTFERVKLGFWVRKYIIEVDRMLKLTSELKHEKAG